MAYAESVQMCGSDIVAVCDFNEEKLNSVCARLGDGTVGYTDFDKFIEHEGLEAVIVANYFNQHTEYSIRLLERGIHVLCECASNSTMAEGVALVRAAEKSKAMYMLAENYPYMIFNREIKRVVEGGTFGKIFYAEGEYNHPVGPNDTSFIIDYRPTEEQIQNLRKFVASQKNK